MDKELKILILEDVALEVEMAKDVLTTAGIKFSSIVAHDEKTYLRGLTEFHPDIVLSDYILPNFNGMKALLLRNELAPMTPFVVVTGSINDETALECMKAGADDYVTKKHLPHAVRRAIEKKRIEAERDRSEKALRVNEQKLKTALDLTGLGTWEFDIATNQITWSDVTYKIFGRDPALGPPTVEEEARYYSSDQLAIIKFHADRAIEHGEKTGYDLVVNLPGEKHAYLSAAIIPIKDSSGKTVKLYGTVQDVTERKQAEESLRRSEAQYRLLADNVNDVIWIADMKLRLSYVSPSANFLLKRSPEELIEMGLDKILTPASYEQTAKASLKEFELDLDRKGQTGIPFTSEMEMFRKDGTTVWAEARVIYLRDREGKPTGVLGVTRDISKRKLAEDRMKLGALVLDALNKSNLQLDTIRDIVKLIKDSIGFDAVAVRIQKDSDFPFYETNGFCKEFVDAETYLAQKDELGNPIVDSDGNPRLIGICGHVIRGRADPSLPFFTKGGSFWANNATEPSADSSNEAAMLFAKCRCRSHGYESIALIPLRSGAELIGLLQLNDRRAGRISEDFMEFMEGIGASIGIALARIHGREELLNAAAMWRSTFDSMRDMIMILDNDRNIIRVNKAVSETVGLPFRDILGKKCYEIIHQTCEPIENCPLRDVECSINGNRAEIYEPRLGIDYLVDVYPHFDANGSRLGLIHVMHDITERKKTEEALRESEERFREAFMTSPDAIFVASLEDGKYIQSNDRLCNMFGWTREELLEKTSSELGMYSSVGDRANFREELNRNGRIEEIEVKGKRKDGNEFWASLSASIIHLSGKPHILGVIRDISERKKIEEELRRSEDSYRDIVENSQDLICTHDLDGFIQSANPGALDMLGYPRDEILKMNISDILDPSVKTSFSDYIDEIRARGFSKGLMIVRTAQGEKLIWEYHNTLRTEGVSEPIVRGMAHDVTKQKHAENKLLESEQKFRNLYESSRDAIMILDRDSFLDCNQAALEMFGLKSRDEFAAKRLSDVSPPTQLDGRDSRAASQEYIEEAYRAGGMRFHWVHKRANGVMFPAEVSLSRFEIGRKQLLQAVVRDISERKSMEEALIKSEQQLLQSQKLEAIGRLAGGVAHDFNNMLAVILSYSGLVEEQLNKDDPILKDVEVITQAAEKGATLTRQLLAFSRKQIMAPKIVNLNDSINEMDKILRRTIGEDVELLSIMDPDLWMVKIDLGQFEQVIMNLAINARDAMPKGGKLVIKTANLRVNGDESERNPPQLAHGNYVSITFRDTGVGMDGETRLRIFEPFFTTKDVDKGTGLGLSTVYGIVKQTNGHITVDSEPGKGATFKIYLPIALEAAEAVAAPKTERRLSGNETVLLVEDDMNVRKATKRVLENAGYSVLDVPSGEDAIQVCETGEKKIHLLLTDVIMPGLGGEEVARQISERRPEMKVIYMSGYTDDAIAKHGVLEAGTHFVQKPFYAETLLGKVREALDA